MAGGIDREIFESTSESPDAPPRDLTEHLKSPDDKAVSDAIQRPPSQPLPPPAEDRPPPPSPPGPHEDDRSSVPLRVLLDERERRQEMARRLERFEQMERERQQAASAPPLSQRLFEDPDGTIAAIEQKIREQEIAPIRQRNCSAPGESRLLPRLAPSPRHVPGCVEHVVRRGGARAECGPVLCGDERPLPGGGIGAMVRAAAAVCGSGR